jgi:hypothetical protein
MLTVIWEWTMRGKDNPKEMAFALAEYLATQKFDLSK